MDPAGHERQSKAPQQRVFSKTLERKLHKRNGKWKGVI